MPFWRWADLPARRQLLRPENCAPKHFYTNPIPFPVAPIVSLPSSQTKRSSDFLKPGYDCMQKKFPSPARRFVRNLVAQAPRLLVLTILELAGETPALRSVLT